MNRKIEFTRNYNDLCTNQGFQFEFICDRCGTGYRTRFKPSATGTATSLLETASGLFGGIFGKASGVGEQLRSATWEKAHDQAFMAAMEELRPDFIQCPRCSSWVCKSKCWNAERGICKHCAPDLGVEMSAAQANRSVEEVWAHARMAEKDKKLGEENWKETIRASCPECSATLSGNTKFCPECGAKINNASFCKECGNPLAANAKFCPDCGTKV